MGLLSDGIRDDVHYPLEQQGFGDSTGQYQAGAHRPAGFIQNTERADAEVTTVFVGADDDVLDALGDLQILNLSTEDVEALNFRRGVPVTPSWVVGDVRAGAEDLIHHVACVAADLSVGDHDPIMRQHVGASADAQEQVQILDVVHVVAARLVDVIGVIAVAPGDLRDDTHQARPVAL
ncbi:hypothetical protein D9M71_339610 [compost metagenome]